MKVLVNALSVTNQSGRHVLMGHLDQIREWTEGVHEYVILYHDTNRDIVVDRPGYKWIECPGNTARWASRAFWEYRNLNKISEREKCDFIFTPAGVSVPGIKTPQVVFCQNPWCMVPELHHTFKDKVKAWLQRRAYRRTMIESTLMVFNSHFMHQAYRTNAGADAKNSMVVYQAIADSTWEAAERLEKSLLEKHHIVSVSAMAPHKGADVLVRAFRLVRDEIADAKLTFAGGWPDKDHRAEIEKLVQGAGINRFGDLLRMDHRRRIARTLLACPCLLSAQSLRIVWHSRRRGTKLWNTRAGYRYVCDSGSRRERRPVQSGQ